MTKRKAITKKLAVDALLLRVFTHFGVYLPCALSGEPMMPGDAVQFDHIHAHGLGGPHVYDNLRPVLAKPHQKKTKADLRMIKKTRPGHTETFVVHKEIGGGVTVNPHSGEDRADREAARRAAPGPPKRKWPSRPMRSRPFEKRKAS